MPPSNGRSYTNKVSPKDCLNLSGPRTTKDMPELIRKSSGDLNLIPRTTDNEDAESGRNCFPQGKHGNWLSYTKWSALSTYMHTSNITQIEKVIFRNIYVYNICI